MISSLSNPQIRHLGMLMRKARYRSEQQQYVAEGLRVVMEVPGPLLVKLYISEDFSADEAVRHWFAGKPAEAVSRTVFKELAQTTHPQGVLALVRMRHEEPEEMLGEDSFLILEGLSDPGNLGTILRTAEGAGMGGIFLTHTCVDVYNPKVVRAAMGSLYRVPFARVDSLQKLTAHMRQSGVTVYAAQMQDSTVCFDADLSGRTAVMIGNEANGLTPEARKLADAYLRIPMCGQLESLNAAMAAGILMYEMRRQKMTANR